MAKHHKLELTETEIQALVELRDKGEPAYLRERATVLLKIHQGSSPHEVACKGLLKARDPDTLLPNQQFLRRSEITNSQRVEINTTRNALANVIPTIPIRRTSSCPDNSQPLDAPSPNAAQPYHLCHRSSVSPPQARRDDTVSTFPD